MSKAALVENLKKRKKKERISFYDLRKGLIIKKNLLPKDEASDVILYLRIIRYNTQ